MTKTLILNCSLACTLSLFSFEALAQDYQIKVYDSHHHVLAQAQLHEGQTLNEMENHQYVSSCEFTNKTGNDYLANMETGLKAWHEGDNIHVNYTIWLKSDKIDNDGCTIEKPHTAGLSLIFQLNGQSQKKFDFKTKMKNNETQDTLDPVYEVSVSPLD